jgi:N-methylhydantoinase A
VYAPADLHPGLKIAGPAIVEEPTTTLVVFPGMSARISGAGHYLLDIGASA